MQYSEIEFRQIELFTEYVSSQFQRKGIVRKYTGELYINHCVEVVDILKEFGLDDFISTMISIGHDLFEDIDDILPSHVIAYFQEIGLSSDVALQILQGIVDLTDRFTSEKFPELNRKVRKTKESERLSKVPGKIQTIKYADLISNTKSIVEHDEKFARTYLEEKQELLNLLTKGDELLYHLAKSTLYESLFKISKNHQNPC